MASVYRYTAVWNGFTGAPGYSKFSFNDSTTDTARNNTAAAVRLFFNSMATYMANTWTISIQPTVQEFDMASGDLIGEQPILSPPASVTGGGAPAAHAGGSGFCISWKTTVIFLGRRVQGRTFMVPMQNCFDTDGTISAAALTAAQGAANTLVGTAGSELCVWGKSWSSAVPPVQTGGVLAPVTSAIVKDAASQLRSRRT